MFNIPYMVSILIKLQTLIQVNLQDLQDYIKEKGMQYALLWKPCQLIGVIDF